MQAHNARKQLLRTVESVVVATICVSRPTPRHYCDCRYASGHLPTAIGRCAAAGSLAETVLAMMVVGLNGGSSWMLSTSSLVVATTDDLGARSYPPSCEAANTMGTTRHNSRCADAIIGAEVPMTGLRL